MGLLSRLFGRQETEQRAAPPLDAYTGGGMFMLQHYGGGDDAGVNVTPETALQAAAVWGCVGRISRDLSTLSLHVYDRETNSRVYDHPVAQLMRSPNPYHTGAAALMQFTANLLLYGWAGMYVEQAGVYPSAIYPLMSRSVMPERAGGELLYRVSTSQTLRADQVAGVAGMSLDGVTGISPLRMGSRTVGTTIALDQFAARFFSQGANVGTVFELPPMSTDALKDTHEILTQQYNGLVNAHRPVAIPGVKVHKLGNTPRDSQAVEARKHQLTEVAMLYHCPVGILDAERSQYAGLESQYQDYSQACLRPWAVLIEQEFSRKLFPASEQGRYTLKFNLDSVVRASLNDRAEADAKLVTAGIITPDEARAHHDLGPTPGGDKLMSPLNMAPADERSRVVEADIRLRSTVAAVAESIATREANAARRAAKGDDFAAWADSFFSDQAAHLRERLPFLTGEQAESLVSRSRALIEQAHNAGDLDDLLSEWQNLKSSEMLKLVE